MSVLNQMLRDLDARQATPPQIAPLFGAAAVTRRRAAPVAYRWLAGWLLLSALIGWFYFSDDTLTASALLLQPKATVSASPATAPAPAVVAVTASPALHLTDKSTAQAITATPVVEQSQQTTGILTSPAASAGAAPEPNPKKVAQSEPPQASHAEVIAQPAIAQPAAAEQLRDSTAGQLSIEPVTTAVSSVAPADNGISLSEATRPVLATQLQQLQQWQQTKNWPAILAAVTPALRQQYPQQVLALEAYAAGQLGEHQRALQAAQLWAQQSPADARAWLAQAIALDQLAQPTQARLFYQRALQLSGLSVASQQYIRQRLATGG